MKPVDCGKICGGSGSTGECGHNTSLVYLNYKKITYAVCKFLHGKVRDPSISDRIWILFMLLKISRTLR
jgi:hypothetical protein